MYTRFGVCVTGSDVFAGAEVQGGGNTVAPQHAQESDILMQAANILVLSYAMLLLPTEVVNFSWSDFAAQTGSNTVFGWFTFRSARASKKGANTSIPPLLVVVWRTNASTVCAFLYLYVIPIFEWCWWRLPLTDCSCLSSCHGI